MTKYMIAGSCLSVLLCAGPVSAQSRPSSTTVPPESSKSAASYKPALRSLQDARTTLSALTEESMSHDAHAALGSINTNFRALYKAYTGAEPDERKSTGSVASKHTPDPSWKADYAALRSSIDAMLGSSSVGTSGQAGATTTTGDTRPNTASSAAGNGRHLDLPKPVQDGLMQLRQRLADFDAAAVKNGSGTAK